MVHRPKVPVATEYGNAASFWVEYPSGLVDLTRTAHLPKGGLQNGDVVHEEPAQDAPVPPLHEETQLEIPVDGGRVLRLSKKNTAIVVVDMQNFFLHPDLREHPTGLNCVIPLMNLVTSLRPQGVKTLWVNWGLTDHELTTIPPALVRGFRKNGRGGFGSQLPGDFGRLLMRGEFNSELYGPLQTLYEEGRREGTDVWIHKNRMSGIWGSQTALDLYLQEQGITTLLFAGVNADQCVLGTLVDAYSRGYDCIVIDDCIATTSPAGGLENVLYNAGGAYGFVTDSERITDAVS
ncbi:Isochorismatase hydrolase [Trametes versicolor FP-101664 SS1]|uniref:Isochorismatase hydrolase n=1 Tax=Trametes versicolor (strain FP-101664) TaxID=717944 RepID=UPI00046224F9|nr:Isochorismatase hydrolase [Trametes versicolor FP-101664 SS1]EIW64610.1 Isochorismatase hydrolase [Trametes versicolor FP-101664 SS1]